MCIDYSDRNNAYPQEHAPLPEIHQEVESLEVLQLKCFFNAYKGYHPVQICWEDKEKTTFHTDRGTFYYQKMPFGLKNVGAIYQYLIYKVFSNQIDRNVKVYVDDIVIKIRQRYSEKLKKPSGP